jgi:autophagy-related protein 5
VDEPDNVEDSSHEEADTTKRRDSIVEPDAVSARAPSDKYPLCWFEDDETELPLQWQLFVGVLYDCHSCRSRGETNRLPWKIRVHFTNYPYSQLLDLDVFNNGILTTIQRTFRNSLKQALVLEHGQNKVALNMTKLTHERIWDSIVTSKYGIYKPIKEDIQATAGSLDLMPIRLLIGSNRPLIQKRCSNPALSLGGLFVEWLPNRFRITDVAKQTVAPVSERLAWRIAGLVPPLETLVIDLWQSLSHPDNFLYIVVVQDE